MVGPQHFHGQGAERTWLSAIAHNLGHIVFAADFIAWLALLACQERVSREIAFQDVAGHGLTLDRGLEQWRELLQSLLADPLDGSSAHAGIRIGQPLWKRLFPVGFACLAQCQQDADADSRIAVAGMSQKQDRVTWPAERR